MFPWTLSTQNVPLYPENFEQLCTTDIRDSQCKVNVDAGTLVTKEVPYSGSKAYSGEAHYDGMLPVAVSGAVPFTAYDKAGDPNLHICGECSDVWAWYGQRLLHSQREP